MEFGVGDTDGATEVLLNDGDVEGITDELVAFNVGKSDGAAVELVALKVGRSDRIAEGATETGSVGPADGMAVAVGKPLGELEVVGANDVVGNGVTVGATVGTGSLSCTTKVGGRPDVDSLDQNKFPSVVFWVVSRFSNMSSSWLR